ncbi:hypothetical protein SESBI_19728 [Sesbania bispinosa]|nr:hypothetical protein SESBI_19728 [Sesbania bispinosa]
MNLITFSVPFLLLLLLAVCSSFNGHVDAPTLGISSISSRVNGFSRPSARSLLSIPPNPPTTALVAALDGTMYLVERHESGSMMVIWSFSTGSPIYSSYQASVNKDNGKENASAALINGFVECGDDWSLYMHDEHFGKMRISESIAEYVAHTPPFHDGAITLGSKRTTLFEVDAKNGSIIRIHAMSDIDNASAPWSNNRQSVANILSAKNEDLSDPVKLNSPQLLLKIFRTDYSLQCVEDGYASDSGLNFAMPYPCQEIQQVFRLKKNFLLEPSITERLPEAYGKSDILSKPTSDLMLPLQPNMDRFFDGHDGNMMLPAPISNSLPSLQHKTNFYDSNGNADVLPQPPMEIMTPGDVYLNRTMKDQSSESELRSSPAKKKKHASQNFNQVDVGVDGRRVGKLFVSNKEIAKGSNGTIVLEGIYEGRAVAVKRLVKAHHDEPIKKSKTSLC